MSVDATHIVARSLSRQARGTASVLVVEDDWLLATELASRLEELHYRVEGPVNTGELALETALRARPDLVLMDIRLKGAMDGITAAARITEQTGAPIVFLTAQFNADTFDRAQGAAPYSYLIKPVDSDDLRCAIEVSLHRHEVEVKLHMREREIEQLNAVLERRVQERTAELKVANRELETVNRELEAFSYSVAHDLRTPLRAIKGFTELVLERGAADLDSDALRHLRSVSTAADRMSKLIDDLLSLARVGLTTCVRELVDLSELATAIGKELQAAHPGREVEFLQQEGVVVQGDPTLLNVALCNLLSNAWKFTARTERAKIQFGAVRSGEELHCFVRDNGIGFDPKRADKLFGVFHRLHNERDFPGNGIGLAIVQRAVGRHGGRVWAEADPGMGATFWFTVP